MRKSTDKKDRVLTYMTNNSRNGIFTGSMSKIASDLGFNHASSVRNYIIQLIQEGRVEYYVEPERGRNITQYRILGEQTVLTEEIIIEYRGISLKMVYTDSHGYVLSKKQLAKATDDYHEFIDLKVGRNKEQFTPHIKLLDGEQHFDRFAIMLYLSKLDLDDVSDEKRSHLNEFQNIVAEKMADLVIKGRVRLDSKGIANIQTNIASICEISQEQVSDLISDVEKQFNQILEGFRGREHNLERDLKNAKNNLDVAIQDRNHWMGEAQRIRVGN